MDKLVIADVDTQMGNAGAYRPLLRFGWYKNNIDDQQKELANGNNPILLLDAKSIG